MNYHRVKLKMKISQYHMPLKNLTAHSNRAKTCFPQVKSPTGSGKTLAYAVPILNFLQSLQPEITRTDGLYALVILPTRELVLQTYNVVNKLCRAHVRIVPGMLMGGEKKKSEKARLRKGVNILIGTPGRLFFRHRKTFLSHLKEENFPSIERFVTRKSDYHYKFVLASVT